MVPITLRYTGRLHCVATHGPSGSQLPTDAPKDNQGEGAAFSPTDLVATALGTCIATTMAIAGRRKQIELDGLSAGVEKHMSTDSPRRIAKIVVRVSVPLAPDHPERGFLEAAAHACPVHHSLHPDVVKDVTFEWTGAGAAAR